MQYRTGNEIRELFLRFFETKGHRRVHSSSLVPANDPTLLFTNAGMNQFKDLFLGAEKRDYSRATTSQKCVRAGGKHNDLENVGFTRRHHTFFEMLGNFSFGDYFKRDAIQFAWELVTSDEWFGIPKDRLYVTIFEGADGVPRDDEAEQYWIEVGVPKERIFAVRRSRTTSGRWARPAPAARARRSSTTWASRPPRLPASIKPFGQDDARYVEIWNLVFMQFDRSAVVDPLAKTTGYKLTPLPKPSIDTGMGLERVAAVLQGKISNFETDLFTPLIERAAELTGKHVSQSELDEGDWTPTKMRQPAHHRRPRARCDVPHQRRRAALERRPRLRAAQDSAPRHPPRPPARPGEAVPLRDGLRGPRPDAGRLSRAERFGRSRRQGGRSRGEAVRSRAEDRPHAAR